MPQHESKHPPGEEGLVARVGTPGQEVRAGVLGGEGKGGEAVHDHIYPEELDDVEGGLREDGGAHDGDCARGEVDSQLELEELAYVVVDATTPLYRLHNRGKVVVHDNDISRILRNLRPRLPHGEAHIGTLEGGGVVSPVARHRDRLGDADARLLDACYEGELVEGGGAGEDAEVGPYLVELSLVYGLVVLDHPLPEVDTCHDAEVGGGLELRGEDAALPRDGCGRAGVVACNHPYHDARALARLDRVGHLGADRVLKADEADEGEALLPAVLVLRHLVQLPVRDRECAQPLVGKVANLPLDPLPVLVGDALLGPVGAHDAGAQAKDHLGRPFAVEYVSPPLGANARRHPLAVRGEGDRAPLGVVHRVLCAHPAVPPLVLQHLVGDKEERTLGVVPCVFLDLPAGVDLDVALEAGVDHHRPPPQRPDPRRQELPRLCRVPAHLPPRHHPHHAHLARRQGARLVAADGRGATHSLAGAEVPH
mmetsp:Transcript_7173/g.17479  ORF Transcript_7173/g.17479 Transcript_7173/m.17479 type:complete len:481 (-) Transcript_7173:421-1863(-)